MERVRKGDEVAYLITFMAALSIVLITALLAQHLWANSALSRHKFGWSFVTSKIWNPVLGDFGALPFIYGTLVSSLLSAIDQLSKYPRPAFAPEIFHVSQERLQELACISTCGVKATYQPGEGIFLDERLKPETSLFDRSVLLHELVHYVQELNHERGDARPCERWYYREIEAYAIQKTFLMLVGSPVRVGFHANKSTCVDVSQ